MRSQAGRGQAFTPNTFDTLSSRRLAKKAVVALIGLSVIAFGVALIVLPGPGVFVISFGLAILAKQFLWARTLLEPIRKFFGQLKAHVSKSAG